MNKQEFADWLGESGLMQPAAHRLLLNGDWIKANLEFLANVADKWGMKCVPAAAGTIDTPEFQDLVLSVIIGRNHDRKKRVDKLIAHIDQQVAAAVEEAQARANKVIAGHMAYITELEAKLRAATAPVSAVPRAFFDSLPNEMTCMPDESEGAPVTDQIAIHLQNEREDHERMVATLSADPSEEARAFYVSMGAPVSAAKDSTIDLRSNGMPTLPITLKPGESGAGFVNAGKETITLQAMPDTLLASGPELPAPPKFPRPRVVWNGKEMEWEFGEAEKPLCLYTTQQIIDHAVESVKADRAMRQPQGDDYADALAVLAICKLFMEEMHAMPIDWTINESQRVHAIVATFIAAKQAGKES